MKQIIYTMTEQKTATSLNRNFFPKCKMKGKPQIAAQTYHITDGIGNINIYPLVKQQINPIVNKGSNNSNNAKTQKFFCFLT